MRADLQATRAEFKADLHSLTRWMVVAVLGSVTAAAAVTGLIVRFFSSTPGAKGAARPARSMTRRRPTLLSLHGRSTLIGLTAVASGPPNAPSPYSNCQSGNQVQRLEYRIGSWAE